MAPLHRDAWVLSGTFSASKYKILSFYMTADLVFHCTSCSSEWGLLAEMGFLYNKKDFTLKAKPKQKWVKRKKEKQIIVTFSSKLFVETL